MRFIIFVKASKETEAGVMPGDDLPVAVGKHTEDLEGAGEFAFEAPTDTEPKGLAGMYRLSPLRWRD